MTARLFAVILTAGLFGFAFVNPAAGGGVVSSCDGTSLTNALAGGGLVTMGL